MINFKRKIYDKMKTWKEESKGKTALLIEGARRIGKTTIVKQFAQKEYKSFIYIDFSQEDNVVNDLFKNISNIDYFFLQLQLHFKVDLYNRESAIIFDEVQFFPHARQSIKFLVQDGRYDYIETGSLISIKANVKDILIPSEERRINMYPLDAEEFRWACGDFTSDKLIKQSFENKIPIAESVNRKLMKDFRLYMLIGGMPQAINEYLSTNNFKYVDEVKRDILNLYETDLRKIDASGTANLIYNSFTANFSSKIKKLSPSNILKNKRASNLSQTLFLLKDSKMILLAHNVTDPSSSFYSSIDISNFKLFCSDTGLLVTKMFKNKPFVENVIYEKLLNDKLDINLGYVLENMVAQIISSNDIELFYHVFANKISHHNYEIDFLLSKANKIIPLEIKSSNYKSHKSLDEFGNKYSNRILEKYVIYTKPPIYNNDIHYLPIYFLPYLLKSGNEK